MIFRLFRLYEAENECEGANQPVSSAFAPQRLLVIKTGTEPTGGCGSDIRTTAPCSVLDPIAVGAGTIGARAESGPPSRGGGAD